MSKQKYQIYKGETVLCRFTLQDDHGTRIGTCDDIVIVLTDLTACDRHGVLLTLRIDDGITHNDESGEFGFVLTPEQTSALPPVVGIEVRVTVGGIVRIATHTLLQTVNNLVQNVKP